MPTRRVVFAGAAVAALCVLPAARAHAQGAAGLGAIVSTISAAVDVVGKLGDNILKATQDGLKIWDISSARANRQQYLDLTQRLSQLYAQRNVQVLRTLTQYIRLYTTSPKPLSPAARATLTTSWGNFTFEISNTLSLVHDIASSLQQDHGLFAATAAYRDLLLNLEEKGGILREISDTPAPLTDPEIEQLKQLDLEFTHLHEALAHLIDALDAYIAAS